MKKITFFAIVAIVFAWSPILVSQDVIPPSLVSITPNNNTIDVALSSDVILTFDEAVQLGNSPNPSLFLRNETNNRVEVNRFLAVISINDNIVTINPNRDLYPNKEYTFFFSDGFFEDLNGNPVNEFDGPNEPFSFFTITTAENIEPIMTSISPEDNSIDVPLDIDITLTFSEDISVQQNPGLFRLFRLEGTGIPNPEDVISLEDLGPNSAGVIINNNSVELNFNTDLQPNTRYLIQVVGRETLFQDDAGNPWGAEEAAFESPDLANLGYIFTTADGVADIPTTTIFNPISNSTNVPANQVFTVQFNEILQITDDNLSVSLLEPSSFGGAAFYESMSIANGGLSLSDDGVVSTLLITPSQPMPFNKSLTISIPAGLLEDLSGNAWQGTEANNGLEWQFSTEFGDTSCVSGDLDLEITFDNFAEETSWEIINGDGSAIVDLASYTNNESNTTITDQITGLANGLYTFRFLDVFGDGICCANGFGNFKVSKNGIVLFEGGQFLTQQSFIICIDSNVDSEIPVITSCASDTTLDAGASCASSVSVGLPTATDNVSTNFTFEGVRADGFELTDPYFVGTTAITWTATDEAGNISASCEQLITVTGTGDCWFDIGPELSGTSESSLGSGVSINGDGNIIAYMVPNANGNGNDGNAIVLENTNGTWNQLGSPISAGFAFGRGFSGIDLNDSGSRVAVSKQSGNVQVYEFNNGVWSALGAEIVAAGQTFIQKVDFDASGDRLAIGYAGENESRGRVVVYELQSGSWLEIGGVLNGDTPGDSFGRDVSLNANGTILAVGAYQIGFNSIPQDLGYVRTFQLENGIWTQIGEDINGENQSDFFGVSCSLNAQGNRLIIGANAAGYAKIYEFNNGIWSQLGNNLVNSTNEQAGYHVDINEVGDVVLVGNFSQPARIFQWNGATWNLLGQPIYAEVGQDVAINKIGNTVVLGAPEANGRMGKVAIFEYSGVLDSEAPVITCPDNIEVVIGDTDTTANVVLTNPTATDNNSTTFTFEGVRSDALALTDSYPIGATTITWTVTDQAGNVSISCDQTISVFEAESEAAVVDGELNIKDCTNDTDDTYDVTVEGGFLILSNNAPILVNADGAEQRDANTVAIPLNGLTMITINGGNGTDTLTLPAGLDLNALGVDLVTDNIDVMLNGTGTLDLANLSVNNGDFATNTDVTINVSLEANFFTDGTLSGNGTLSGVVNMNVDSNLFPGTSPGILNTGNLTLDNNNNDFEVEGTTPGAEHDQVVVTGTVTIVTGTTLNLITGYANDEGDEIILISNDATDPIVGVFDGLAEGGEVVFGDFTGTISYVGGDGNDLVLIGTVPAPELPFITTWIARNNALDIFIPVNPAYTYDYTVDWGDGTIENNFTGNASHVYAAPGTYAVRISGNFPAIYFNNENGPNIEKILSIDQWGTSVWQSMENAFYGCREIDMEAIDIPDLSNVTSMSRMFERIDGFQVNASINDWQVGNVTDMSNMFKDDYSLRNMELTNWDVSNVTNMLGMFENTGSFDGDISGWNVSKVTDMSNMFNGTDSFNADISGWNVAMVTNMSGMFNGARSFNQDISSWQVGSVTNMSEMFSRATIFNQNIDGWNVGMVTDMSGMFSSARDFDQSLAAWNVSSVTNMAQMFANTTSFDQNLGGWNVSNLADAQGMFQGKALSTPNYDALLQGWSTQTLQSNVVFSGGNSVFCDAVTAKQAIVDTYGWTISDGGNCVVDTDAFVTSWIARNNALEITIPTNPAYTYDYTVDWGDGSITQETGDATHVYAATETYSVRITGDFPAIYFNNGESANAEKLEDVLQWGTIMWQTMEGAFYGCREMDMSATDIPNLSSVTSMSRMFSRIDNLRTNVSIGTWDVSNVIDMSSLFHDTYGNNFDISGWDVSNVEDMSYMFNRYSNFDNDLSGWDVSKVTNMSFMFASVTSFNGNISGWDVSNVTNMNSMFRQASSFNQDISSWQVGNVMDMGSMFQTAREFSSNISSWNVSGVTDMSSMFESTRDFNQDIGNWITTSLSDISSMFKNAESFDQDISTWNISSVTDAQQMFEGTALSTLNYDALLTGWSQQILQDDVVFGGGESIFCDAAANKQSIIDTYSWVISDGGSCVVDTDSFITEWITRGANEQITLPINSAYTYDYRVDWGDGTIDENITGDGTHTYIASGTYQVIVSGDFPAIYFNTDDRDNAEKISDVIQWGTNVWQTMEGAFSGCREMKVTATDIPDFSGLTSLSRMFEEGNLIRGNTSMNDWQTSTVTDMSGMFRDAYSFAQQLTNWDVSNVTNMSQLFDGASSFEGDISGWIVDNVTDMSAMFDSANDFNADISGWNVSNVTNMSRMFRQASSFNQDISSWNVGNVTNMSQMFFQLREFNSDISIWNVSSVTDMSQMFEGTQDFNQNIGSWTTTALSNISSMFKTANSFDQDISAWDVSGVTDAQQLFEGITLSLENYDALLLGWSAQTLQSNVIFGGGNNQYCAGVDGIQILRTTYNWTVSDRGIIAEGLFENGTLDVTDSCGTTNDSFALSSDGTNVVLNNSASPIQVSGDGVVQQDDNTVLIPLNGITNGLALDGGEGDNTLTIDSSLDLTGASNGLTLNNLNVVVQGTDDLQLNALGVSNGDFNTSGSNTAVATQANFNDGASLSGHGSITGEVIMNVNSSLDPGNSPGLLTINGNLTLDNNNNDFEVEGTTPGIEHDQIIVTGSITILAGTTLNLLGGYANADGDEIILIANDGTDPITGTFNGLIEGDEVVFGDFTGTFSYVGGDGNDLVLIGVRGLMPGAFVTTWQTTFNNESITIPTFRFETYDYQVDWGDGTIDVNQTGDSTHSYDSPGFHTVSITGNFPRIYFGDSPFINRSKVFSVDQWGIISWTSMNKAFDNCSNLNVVATDLPDFGIVEDLSLMFVGCSSLNGNSNFSNWDVSKVTNFLGMFGGSSEFNQDIGGWDVSNAENMQSMFSQATSFNQNIGAWDISNITNVSNMFFRVTLSTENYDALLNGWATLDAGETVVPSNITFLGGNSQYCNGEPGKNILESLGWTITDGGINCPIDTPAITNLSISSDSGISNEDDITNINTPVFEGNVGVNNEGNTVEILANGNVVGSSLVNSDGSYLVITTVLQDGVYQITARLVVGSNTGELSDALEINIDTTPPAILNFSPEDDATEVALIADLEMVFNEPIVAGSDRLFILNSNGETGSAINASNNNFTVNGSTITYSNISDLNPNRNYYILLNSDFVQDLAGNSSLAINDNTTWNFDTIITSDTEGPTITNLTPANLATNVLVNGSFEVTFNELVKMRKIGFSARIFENGSSDVFDIIFFRENSFPNPGSVEIVNDRVILNFDKQLNFASTYMLRIYNGIEDLVGNDFQGIAENEWVFTTALADNQAPQITCPEPITVSNELGLCAASFPIIPATATDDVSLPENITIDFVRSDSEVLLLTDPFPVGETTITWTATDEAGNVSEPCEQLITVTDDEAPAAICQNITVDLDENGEHTIVASIVDAGSSDNCGVVTLALSKTTFGIADVGNQEVTMTVTDEAGNQATCIANIEVRDVTLPIAVCQDITVDLDENGIANFTAEDVDNGSNDASGIASLSLSQTSFDCTSINEVNQVTLTVTDNNGNSSSCTATVMVRDVTAPELTCEANITSTSPSGLALTLEIVPPTVSDNCEISPSLSGLATFPDQTTLVLDNQTGSYDFPIGTTAIVWTATDGSNQGTCTQTVTVNFTPSMGSSITSFTVAGVPATIIGANITVAVPFGTDLTTLAPEIGVSEFATLLPASGATQDFSQGTVIYTATAQDGQSATEYNVTISIEPDTANPTIDCPVTITVANDLGECGALVDFTATAADDRPGVVVSYSPNSGSFFEVGITEVTATATDAAGNMAQCTFDVTVNDTEAPTAEVQNVTLELNAEGVASFNVFTAGAIISSDDNCEVDGSVGVTGPATYTCEFLGDNNLTIFIRDVNGNETPYDIVLTVTDPLNSCQDTTLPVIVSCADNTTIDNFPGSCSIPPGNYGEPTATDNETLAENIMYEGTRSDGLDYFSEWPVGITTVTWVAIDEVGNRSEPCEQTITVIDTEAPTAVCEGITVQLDETGSITIFASQLEGGATDNCDSQLSFGITAMPSREFDQNVTPDAIFGSGNTNGSYTLNDTGSVELGLRAKVRYPTPENTFNSNGDGTYTHLVGAGAPATRALWNFEWSVNTDPVITTGNKLADLTYEMGIDFDAGTGTDYFVFDPITQPLADHSIGDNNTANGAGEEATDEAGYTTLLSEKNVAQNSWNLDFFNELAAKTFDPTADGTYDIYLKAFDATGANVGETKIRVIVGEGGSFSTLNNSVTFTEANVGENMVELTVVDAAGNLTTCTGFVTVESPLEPCTVAIDIQPEEDIICFEAPVVRAETQVTATGNGLLSYNWQFSTDNGDLWRDAPEELNGASNFQGLLDETSGILLMRVIVTSDNNTPNDNTDDCSITSDEVIFEVIPLPEVFYNAPADLTIDSGLQTGLGGGSPTQGAETDDFGLYDGPGVTDDGNGMTYSFDPAVAGLGIHTITYTYTNTNGCSSEASDDIEVLPIDDPQECTNPFNVALNKSSSQSSTYGSGEAFYANDGNLEGSSPWSADLQHTSDDVTGPWWEVDLGIPHDIQEVVITNRTNGFQSRLQNFYVFLSSTPFAADATAAELAADGTTNVYFEGVAGQKETIAIVGIGQYIRVQLASQGFLHMAELEAIGCPTGPDVCDGAEEITINSAGPFQDTDGLQQLTASPAGGTWSGAVSADGLFDTGVKAGSYLVTYTFTNEEGCTKSDSATIVIEATTPECTGGDNIALNKPATQSSTYGNGEAFYANDGNLEGGSPWSADLQHTVSGEAQPWWEVDLGSTHELTAIKLYNRTNRLQSRLNNFYIFVSDSPFSGSLLDLLGDPNIESIFFEDEAGLVESFATMASGRYVRVQLQGSGTLHMAEVEVYGCPTDPSVCDGSLPVTIAPTGPFLDTDGEQQLTASPEGGTWSGAVNASGVINPSALGAGTYTVGYMFTNENGCTKSDTITVEVNEDVVIGPCTESYNLALDGTASHSSTYGNGEAFYANDGNQSGSSPWTADLQHTLDEDSEPWWEVDLGEMATLDRVVIYNRTDKLQSRLNNFYVLYSDAPFGARSLADLLADTGIEREFFSGAAGLQETFTISTTARYVRIQKTGSGPLHMAEVEVYGCPFAVPGLRANLNTFNVWPNPASAEAKASFEKPTNVLSLMIYDMQGRIVKVYEPSQLNGGLVIDLGVQTLAPGVYIIRTQDETGVHFEKQLVIKR